MGGDEREDAERDDRKRLGIERPRAQPERGDIAERPDVEEGAASEAVDEPETDVGEDEVGDADADGLEQRGLLAEPCPLEDARREVEDGVDAGKLVEEGDEECEHDRDPEPPREELGGLCAVAHAVLNRVGEFGDLGIRKSGVDHAEGVHPLLAATRVRDQPARALGQAEAHERVNERRERRDPEHPPPRDIWIDIFGEEEVRGESHEDAENDVELEEPGEVAAAFGRRNLRDVERRGDRRGPDADAADEPGEHERDRIRREARSDPRKNVEHADPVQGEASPELLGRPAADQRPEHGPPQRRAHRQPVQERAEAPDALDFLLRPGDDDRVKPEEEARQRRCQRPEE